MSAAQSWDDFLGLFEEEPPAPVVNLDVSWEPPVMPDAGGGRGAGKRNRAYLLEQFLAARSLGRGISTVQVQRCLRTTVAPARVWELVQEGWDIRSHGECGDGSHIFYLESDVQGDPIVPYFGWEIAVKSSGCVAKVHTEGDLSESEKEGLHKHLLDAAQMWVAVNRPEWLGKVE